MAKGLKCLIRSIVWLLWDFSGLRFIWEKIRPPDPSAKERQPPTFLLWVIGIYVAFFGVASQRYENKIDRIENQTNATLTLVVKDESRKSAFRRIASVQSMRCPLQPNILKPTTIFRSLFGEAQTHDENMQFLKGVIVDFKAHLRGTNLREANLWGADLGGAYLRGTNLREANLREANLREAILGRADLREANLWGADLIGAENLTIYQLSNVKTLYEAKLGPELMEKIEKDYPHLLEKPRDQK